jgi:hypothetical protein
VIKATPQTYCPAAAMYVLFACGPLCPRLLLRPRSSCSHRHCAMRRPKGIRVLAGHWPHGVAVLATEVPVEAEEPTCIRTVVVVLSPQRLTAGHRAVQSPPPPRRRQLPSRAIHCMRQMGSRMLLLHTGHVARTTSHVSTQSMWNACMHGSMRRCSPS